MDPKTHIRIRHAEEVRETILELCSMRAEVGIGLDVKHDELTQHLPQPLQELRAGNFCADLHYLAGRHMIETKWNKEDNTRTYRILPKGMDFIDAGFPWELVNEFHPKRKID